MKPVWIVDDDKSIRWVLEKTLAREQIPFKSFPSASEALSQLDLGAEPPQVLVSDIRMPGESGLDLLKQVKLRFPSLPVIIMTAYSDLDSAVAAFQGGAFEYLPKPFDVDQALELIRRALDESMHQSGAPSDVGLVPEILGQAPAMQEVFRAIGRLSQSNATVMIIENAERFGLAQLHQLRGRIGRGSHKSYCILMTDARPEDEQWEKLRIVETTANGFNLAEQDLRLRGPGDVLGTSQSGLKGVRFEEWLLDARLIHRGRQLAEAILAEDPNLESAKYRPLRFLLEDGAGRRVAG